MAAAGDAVVPEAPGSEQTVDVCADDYIARLLADWDGTRPHAESGLG